MNDMNVVLALFLLFAPIGVWIEYQEYKAAKRRNKRTNDKK